MAVDISQQVQQIRTAVFARDVRDSIAGGLDTMASQINQYEEDLSSQQDSVTERQTNLENQYTQQISNNISSHPSSAETVAARTSNATGQTSDTIGHRIDGIDSQLADIMYDVRTPSSPLNKVIGDGVADDTIALQAIHDYIVNNVGRGVILIPSNYVIKITSTFNWDVSKVSIISNGGVLLADINDTSKYAISTISSEQGNPYNQSMNYMSGVILKCKTADSCNGINFNGGTGNNGASRINIIRCQVIGFNIGVNYGTHAYCINFDKTEIYNNNIQINIPSGQSDYGERLSFLQCNIYNGGTAIVCNTNADVYFEQCSIDYNSHQILNITAGIINFIGCHIEQANNAFTSSNRAFELSGNGTDVMFIGGELLFVGSTATTDYIFNNSITGRGKLVLSNVFLHNALTTTGYLITGTGVNDIKTKHYAIDSGAELTNINDSVCTDGSFENGLLDILYITGDTQAITGHALSGQNIVLSESTDYFYDGTHSLKITKTYGSGSYAEFTILIPITVGKIVGWEYFLKNPNSNAGSINIIERFARVDNNYNVIRAQIKGDMTIQLTSTFDWTKYQSNNSPITPNWATHYQLDFNLFSFNGNRESLYLDKLTVTEK